ncbi:MAG: Tfp pilus assembly protein FimT/FimU [Phycisphaerae bacterium]
MRRSVHAFTLIELLIVIAIIALLLSILVPSLGRARALARRAACGAQLRGHGAASAVYSHDYNSYGLMGNCGIYRPGGLEGGGWPKFFSVMQANGLQGTCVNNFGSKGYFHEPDQIWKGVVCPAQNGPKLWKWADSNQGGGLGAGSDTAKLYLYRSAIGYQWNFCLRAQTPPPPVAYAVPSGCPCGLVGRWNVRLEPFYPHGNSGIYRWMDPEIRLPGDPNPYSAQAIRQDEVDRPMQIAEAWDSFDLETCPGYPTSSWVMGWAIENMLPGWHVGPYEYAANGWAVLNGYRHEGSPNVLYADGHVAADADRRLQSSDLGAAQGGGSWTGARVTSWPDYDPKWGSNNHILPRREWRP